MPSSCLGESLPTSSCTTQRTTVEHPSVLTPRKPRRKIPDPSFDDSKGPETSMPIGGRKINLRIRSRKHRHTIHKIGSSDGLVPDGPLDREDQDSRKMVKRRLPGLHPSPSIRMDQYDGKRYDQVCQLHRPDLRKRPRSQVPERHGQLERAGNRDPQLLQTFVKTGSALGPRTALYQKEESG